MSFPTLPQKTRKDGAPVIFQEVVHSFLFGEAGCDEQLESSEGTNGHS